MNLIYIIFAVILVVSAILGRYIHSHKFKYATEGSASLLLGTGITGLVSLVYYASTHEALTPSSLRLPDSVFFQVIFCSGSASTDAARAPESAAAPTTLAPASWCIATSSA